MKIAVEGCAHGELEIIYDTIQALEEAEGIKVDLLICCGDFQATRNEEDLYCMAVPPKYYNMCTFYKYYNGEKTAPILTIFVGGNHEASNHLQELPYGGWVAPNIYYLGYAGVVDIAGLRIGGISGIYKPQDYMKGHHEKTPYDNNTKRSVYHVRNLEVFRLKQLTGSFDVFISHDWPSEIWKHGDFRQLLRFKPFFQEDMDTGKLGSAPCQELLRCLKPKYWFAAHLHCKFVALVRHTDGEQTKFLALDKCLPRKRFLQIMEVPHDPSLKIELRYDLEWLTVLHLTNHLLSTKASSNYLPGPNGTEQWQFTPTEEEKLQVLEKIEDLVIPSNFTKTVRGYDAQDDSVKKNSQPQPRHNPQTQEFCNKLEVDDPLELLDAFTYRTTENCDEDDVENDSSELYETFVQNNSNRLSLKLPEPKNVSGIDEVESVLDKTEVVVECEPTSSLKNVVNSESESSSSPAVKKFKRRNFSMYSSDT